MMRKYTFIVPVYNVEKFLSRCLDSLLNQTYQDFEIIIVDDGSTDGSAKIIKQYQDKYQHIIKSIRQNNSGGVAEPRNVGVKNAIGDYILFVDSDDYISLDTLEILNHCIIDEDVLMFGLDLVDEDQKFISTYNDIEFKQLGGQDALALIVGKIPAFEIACRYVYKRDFFINNHFQYESDRYHEDFGVTPLIIAKAKSVSSIKDKLYFYVQTNNSITRNTDYKKTVKRAYDVLYHFDILYEEFSRKYYNDYMRKWIFSYLANALINKCNMLNGIERKTFIKELKKRRIDSLLLSDTFARKFKKRIISIHFELYLKLVNK